MSGGPEIRGWEHKLTGIVRQPHDKPQRADIAAGDYEPLVRLSDYEQVVRERDEAREYGGAARIRENAAEDARISAHDRAEALEARIAELEGLLAKAETALEPFAELATLFAATGASKVGGPDMGSLLNSARTTRAAIRSAKEPPHDP